jgi:hypothetical protein
VTGSLRLSVRTTASHVVKAGSIPAGITSNLYSVFISGVLDKCIQQPAAIAAVPGIHATIFSGSAAFSCHIRVTHLCSLLPVICANPKTPKARKQGKREVIMDKKNTIIGIVAVVIVLAIIGWASGWFGGQAPQDAMAPATTTEQPAAPATTTEQPATPAPATTPPATTTTQ